MFFEHSVKHSVRAGVKLKQAGQPLPLSLRDHLQVWQYNNKVRQYEQRKCARRPLQISLSVRAYVRNDSYLAERLSLLGNTILLYHMET